MIKKSVNLYCRLVDKSIVKKVVKPYYLLIVILYILMTLLPADISTSGDRAISIDGSYFVITPDNVLVGWGLNEHKTIKNGISIFYPYLFRKTMLHNVSSVQATTLGTMALDNNGTLWGWGSSLYLFEYAQGKSKLMEDVSTFALGYHHAAVIKTDGTLWTWGRNDVGQLGLGYLDDVGYPPQKIMDDAIAVNASNGSTFAIDSNYNLYALGGAWGSSLTRIATGVEAICNGPNETYSILRTDGTLQSVDRMGDFRPITIEIGVMAIYVGGYTKQDESQWLWNGVDDVYVPSQAMPITYTNSSSDGSEFYISQKGMLSADTRLTEWLPIIPQSMNTVRPILRNLFLVPLLLWLVLEPGYEASLKKRKIEEQ